MLYKHYLLVFAPSLSDDKRINTLILYAGFYNLKKQSDVQKQRKPRFRQFLHSSACVWLVQPKPSAPWIQLHPEKHATAFYTELLRWRRVETTRAHGTEQDLWPHWAAAGTSDGSRAESVPDEPRTREGRTAAGFARGGCSTSPPYSNTLQRPSEK